jgi:multidrug efflux pump subunit AcrA (membrane-fusion protein)
MNQTQLSVPPAPSSPDVVIADGGHFISLGQGVQQAQLRELFRTREGLESTRSAMQAQLDPLPAKSAARLQLEAQVSQLHERIATLDQMIAGVQGMPSTDPTQFINVPPPYISDRALPRDIFALSGLSIVCVLLPLTVAISLRILRRGTAKVASLPSEIAERLGRMESAIEATAIEVERIGEGQRYLTRVLGDRKAEELLERPRATMREHITPH